MSSTCHMNPPALARPHNTTTSSPAEESTDYTISSSKVYNAKVKIPAIQMEHSCTH